MGSHVIIVEGQWICGMELGDEHGHSFDTGEPAWLSFGRARRKKVFQVTACKGLPHLECGCVVFLVATSALWVSAAKKYTVRRLSYKVKIECV